jgi:GDP-4-dehydro-6-deoxy-D-mannose reductase
VRVLVLGSSGFVGRHTVAELAARGAQVESWSRYADGPRDAHVHRRIDLLQPETFESFTGPWDGAVLLAGHSVPGILFTEEHAQENLRIAENALRHLANTSPRARVIVLSSSHVYGNAGSAQAITEDRKPTPVGAYGVSKLAVEKVAESRTDLDIAIVRSFNLIGPRMPRGLLMSDVIEELARDRENLVMRGTDSVRDFLDVRDGARAIAALLALRGGAPVYNLCSGVGTRVSQVVSGLVRLLGAQRDISFSTGSSPPFVGSHAALTAATGWTPEFVLDATLQWIAAEVVESR